MLEQLQSRIIITTSPWVAVSSHIARKDCGALHCYFTKVTEGLTQKG